MKENELIRDNTPLRAVMTVGFLMMLVVCGWAGSSGGANSVSTAVPITRTVWQHEQTYRSMEEIKQQLTTQRQEAITLLDSVIACAETSSAARQSALTQKAEIARRMENEAMAESSLALMDIGRATVVCSEVVTVFLECPQEETDEQTAARITEVVSAQIGCARSSVKVIPVEVYR